MCVYTVYIYIYVCVSVYTYHIYIIIYINYIYTYVDVYKYVMYIYTQQHRLYKSNLLYRLCRALAGYALVLLGAFSYWLDELRQGTSSIWISIRRRKAKQIALVGAKQPVVSNGMTLLADKNGRFKNLGEACLWCS